MVDKCVQVDYATLAERLSAWCPNFALLYIFPGYDPPTVDGNYGDSAVSTADTVTVVCPVTGSAKPFKFYWKDEDGNKYEQIIHIQ